MQLPLAPFLLTLSYEWPEWDKTQQQRPQEVPPLGAKHWEVHLSDPILVLAAVHGMFLYTLSHMSSKFLIIGHLMPDECPQ